MHDDNYKQLLGEIMSDISSFVVECECDALYHDECVKVGVKSIIAVNYDIQIGDNRE